MPLAERHGAAGYAEQPEGYLRRGNWLPSWQRGACRRNRAAVAAETRAGEFRKLARKLSRCFADMRQDFKARAAITGRGIRIDPAAYERAARFLSDTLDQLNQLNNDAECSSDFDDEYNNSENNISPHL